MRLLTSIPTAWLLLLSVASAQNQCYYGDNKRAGSAIIPCGGSGVISSCCQLGDLCLSDSACWNPTYNVTYLYGCTDSTYTDSTCPWKCGGTFETAPYVGLDYCSNTTLNQWSCTHPPSNSDSIQAFPAQECIDDSIIAFAGPSSLQPILSLPTDVGGPTVWFSEVNPTSYSLDPGYTPATTSIHVTASVPTTVEAVSPTTTSTTSTSSSTSTSSTSSSSSTTATTTSEPPIIGVSASSAASTFSPTNTGASAASATSSSPSPSRTSHSSGLSTGAKIGIGVGVGLGGLGLLALGGAIFFVLRRRRTHEPVSQTDHHDVTAGVDTEYKRPRPPSELPGTVPGKYEQRMSGGYGGQGENNSSTQSNWGSPAPTYTTAQQQVGPRPVGHDRVHELG